MSPKREQIDPPDLEGYRFKERLGSGGFSDVFLYERHFPRQDVAIKVLDRLVRGGKGQEIFTAEANAMASLSTHPYIVTIFHADVSPEGHPYLVMEYYPGSNYSLRSKSERFSVSQVLRLGVHVASAVETAHRSGILHRDIKPANILTSAYGRPGLTDFGIAASLGSEATAAEGLSIPWSPPEALGGVQSADERSDVYSLAATLYTVLQGHSPFERPGEESRSIDLIDRIERQSLPPFDRTDVPGSLFRLLSQAMAKDPGSRPASVADMARSLQAIEVEQRFDLTPMEVTAQLPDLPEAQAIDADAGSTRVKGPTVIEGQSKFASSAETVSRDTLAAGKANRPSVVPIKRVPFTVPPAPTPPTRATANTARADATASRPASASYQPMIQPTPSPMPPIPKVRRSPKALIGVAAGLVVLIAVVASVVSLSSGGSTASKPAPPTGIHWTAAPGASGVVTWSTSGDQPGDTYTIVYGGNQYNYTSGICHRSATVFSCTLPDVSAPLDNISLYRIRHSVVSKPGVGVPTVTAGGGGSS
jgi:serine/threonine protein kinase